LIGRLLFALDLRGAVKEFFECVERMQQLFQKIDASPVAAEGFAKANQQLDELLRKALDDQPSARSAGPLFRLFDAGEGLENGRLLEELRNFLLAGTMTTSLLLGIACALLGRHPDE